MVNQVLETSHLPCSAALCLCVSVAGSSSILRTHFQVPYPATPLFATLAKTAGVCTNNSQFGTHHLSLITCYYIQVLSFQTLAHSFALTKITNHFFSIGSALFAKNHPGGSTPLSVGDAERKERARQAPPLLI